MRHATLSVSVYNTATKKNIYSHDAQRSVRPASLTKLFTTATGFDRLGSNFRFRTTLSYSGSVDSKGVLHGDIYIIGGGDPLLGYRQTSPDTIFSLWRQAMSAAGIRSVDGRVCYDGSIFDKHPIHDNWCWSDIGNYYGSGAYGLNFHENMFFIYFTPGSRVGQPTKVSRFSPVGLAPLIINEVMTGPAKSGDNVIVYGDPNSTIRTCSGTMPLDGKNFSVRASLPRPGETCAELFIDYLRQHKISVKGAATESANRPAGLTTLLEYTSPVYSVIAQYTNMTSNNPYAEAIHKYLGFKGYGVGSSTNGARVVSESIKKLGVESSGVVLDDGCGLSSRNRVTADFVSRYLCALTATGYYGNFRKSLPQAGVSGTVKNLLKNMPEGVTMELKTGSVTGVRSYASYVTGPSCTTLCFTVIANDYDCSGTTMRAKMEKLLYQIALMAK